jgi:hypothetical protein
MADVPFGLCFPPGDIGKALAALGVLDPSPGFGNSDQQELAPAGLSGEGAGNYVIPGATLGGLIRSAMEIVAFGKLGSANLHHRFGIRDFEHPYYESVAKVGQVKAGWLTGAVDRNGRFTMRITPCDWAHVLIDDMAADSQFKAKVSARQNWIQMELEKKYGALGMTRESAIDFTATFGYGPAFDDNGRAVRNPLKGGTPGEPVFSGKLPGTEGKKKYEYAFFDRPGASAVSINDEIVEDFIRLNSKPSKNRPLADGSWKKLKPTFEAGHRVPVFYVGDLARGDRDFFFGLTRMLKVPHERSVGGVLAGQGRHRATAKWLQHENGSQELIGYDADFVENLFGFVVEPKDLLPKDAPEDPGIRALTNVARKGRVAFSFASLIGGPGAARLSAPIAVVQSAPRASFAAFYLKPAKSGGVGGEADYSAHPPPRLAGRKRYLPRNPAPDLEGRLTKIEAMGGRQREAIRGGPGGRDTGAGGERSWEPITSPALYPSH